MNDKSPLRYKYVIESDPIDLFYGCTTLKEQGWCKEEILAQYCQPAMKEYIDSLYTESVSFARAILPDLCGGNGEDIREFAFFAIPNPGDPNMEFCMIVKVDNNGTTYTFTNNEFLANYLTNYEGSHSRRKLVYWRGMELFYFPCY